MPRADETTPDSLSAGFYANAGLDPIRSMILVDPRNRFAVFTRSSQLGRSRVQVGEADDQ